MVLLACPPWSTLTGTLVAGDLLERLEMHIGVLLEHFNEIDQQYANSPVVIEAASSIIFAGGSQTESKGAHRRIISPDYLPYYLFI